MTVQCAVTPTSYPMKSMTVKLVLSLSAMVTSSYLVSFHIYTDQPQKTFIYFLPIGPLKIEVKGEAK